MAEAATLEREQTDHFDQCEQELQAQPEQRNSFDVLASARMFRYDLQRFGQVLPETRERVADEELSYMVEGMNRASRTDFKLKRIGNDLYYYKNGEWASYAAMVEGGADIARREAQNDYRRKFLADAEADNVAHMLQMRKLKPGESYVYHSPYNYQEEGLYGAAFMESCGRFPGRKMGFLYRAYCNDADNVLLESQTVDNSNGAGFERAMRTWRRNPNASMDDLVDAYDSVFEEPVYAGRPQSEIGENAWDFIQAQGDLIEFFINKLKAIAAMPLHEDALEEAVKRHVYGTWAAFKQRLDGVTTMPSYQPAQGAAFAHLAMLEREVHRAFTDFAERGVPMVGCGGKIEVLQGEDAILNASPESVFKAIFGEDGKGASDEYGSLTFECTNGHTNTRKRGKLLTNCKVKGCHDSVGCGPKRPEPAKPTKRQLMAKKYGKYATSHVLRKPENIQFSLRSS